MESIKIYGVNTGKTANLATKVQEACTMDWKWEAKYDSKEEYDYTSEFEAEHFLYQLGQEVLQDFINKGTVALTITHEEFKGKNVPETDDDNRPWTCPPNPETTLSVYRVKIREVPEMQEVKLYMPCADYHFGKGKPENVRTKLKNCFDYLTDKDGDKYKSEWKKV